METRLLLFAGSSLVRSKGLIVKRGMDAKQNSAPLANL